MKRTRSYGPDRFGKRPSKRTKIQPAVSSMSRSILPSPMAGRILTAGFPTKKTVKLRYCQEISLTITSGYMAYHGFRLNSLFDPDYTSTGHQPLGFDQWAAIYDKYCVTRAAISCRSTHGDKAAYDPIMMGIHIQQGDTFAQPPSAMADFAEHNDNSRLVGPLSALPAGDYGGSLAAKQVVDVAKLAATKDLVGNADWVAPVANNPTEVVWGSVCIYAPAIATDTYQFLVEMEFDVTFFDPKDLAGS